MKTALFEARGRSAKLLTEEHKRELSDFFSYFKPGARFSPMYNKFYEDGTGEKKRVWDGRERMLKYNRVPMGLLRGMKEELKEAGWKIALSRWIDRPRVDVSAGASSGDPKYAYQDRCVDAMLKAVEWGGGTVLSCTGSGKTKIAGSFGARAKAARILFVVDQVNLLYQSREEISKWLGEPVGVVGNSEFAPERFTVATVQTLAKHKSSKRMAEWIAKIQIVFVDEVHVQMSRRNFKIVEAVKPEAVFGLTATLEMRKKHVRMKVMALAGPIIFEFPVAEGMESGVLCKGVAVQARVEDSAWLSKSYESSVVDNAAANRCAARIAKAAIARGHSVVVLTERIRHLKNMKTAMTELGLSPKIACGAVSQEEREKKLGAFERGESKLVLASKIFVKGVNVKRVSFIIDCAQRANRNDALQKFGRGVRLHPEKKGLIYADVASIPSQSKAASSRMNAFKKAGIKTMWMPYFSAESLIDAAEKLLEEELSGKGNQPSLFHGKERQ